MNTTIYVQTVPTWRVVCPLCMETDCSSWVPGDGWVCSMVDFNTKGPVYQNRPICISVLSFTQAIIFPGQDCVIPLSQITNLKDAICTLTLANEHKHFLHGNRTVQYYCSSLMTVLRKLEKNKTKKISWKKNKRIKKGIKLKNKTPSCWPNQVARYQLRHPLNGTSLDTFRLSHLLLPLK